MSLIDPVIPSTAAELRQANRARALWAIHIAKDHLTRAQLARELDCTRATAAVVVSELKALGLIVESSATPTGQRGRPSLRLIPAQGGPVVIAVEVGVDAVRIATVGLGGKLTDVESTPLKRDGFDQVLGLARAMLHQRVQLVTRRCMGVGIAVHGLVEEVSGIVSSAPNLGWEGVDVLSSLEPPVGVPVRIDNVAHLSALAEVRRGRGRGLTTVLYLHAAIGLGGALVLDGHPLHGRTGFAGEYGHLPLGREDRPCRCGGHGCWETEVDQPALARAAGEHSALQRAGEVAAKVLTDARRGDRPARQAVEQVTTILGRGIGALINVHDPDLVVLGGHAADLLAAAPEVVRQSVRSATMQAHRRRLPMIEPAALDADGGLIGAAESLLPQLITSPPTTLTPLP
jgi:predicted NBD/HSP70 family sugar kinase